jgi:hypothetical protein
MLTLVRIVKWVSIPALLIASLFACCTATYEPLVDLMIWLGAIVFIQRAVRARMFTPLSLVAKIFFLTGLSCIAIYAKLLVAFHTEPAPVV